MNENKIIPVPQGDKVVIDISPKYEKFDKKLVMRKRSLIQKAVEYRTLMIGNTIFQFSIIMIIILILLSGPFFSRKLLRQISFLKVENTA